MEIWASTVNTIEAACLGTLGVQVRLDRTILAGGGVNGKRGEVKVRWHLKGGNMAGIDKGLASLRSRFWSKELEAEEPGHPLLDCFAGVRNFQRVLDLQRGRGIYLRKCPGGRWQYELGGGALPGRRVAPNASTQNLAMVAALARVGVPLLELEGPRDGRHKYYLPVVGLSTELNGPGADTIALMKGWVDRSLDARDPESPFLYAMRAVLNWRRFTREAREMVANLAIQKPRSKKGAIVREDASGHEFDRVTRFFNR